MKKKRYTAPVAELTEVQMEQGFMGGSIVNPGDENSDVTSGSQEIENSYGFDDNNQYDSSIWQ